MIFLSYWLQSECVFCHSYSMKHLRQIHNCLAFSSLRSQKNPLHLPFGGIWVQNCWKGLSLPTKCCAPDKQSFWKLGEIPYSSLARNRCMWLCILSHSQPKLHFYVSFFLFPNATFRPELAEGDLTVWACMSVRTR